MKILLTSIFLALTIVPSFGQSQKLKVTTGKTVLYDHEVKTGLIVLAQI